MNGQLFSSADMQKKKDNGKTNDFKIMRIRILWQIVKDGIAAQCDGRMIIKIRWFEERVE